ncbi:NUDIX hydrolase [Roseibium aggregatum]|uniref:NUDIX domain-containing protein n=1 Tax=Roseibium aggregatum TaxID=187304 RepID=A0A926P6R1_9HYPH|nr:NUDIX domain-containing protein [Roseibium aggregatum]MBD1549452.1 NUDIX domain-containing protein [Roseibium aggregatum]
MRTYHKAYVYLTCGSRLLVFSQPDQPDVGLQVPGGTLDPGESHLIGAKREFLEETGLDLDIAFHHLADQEHVYDQAPGMLPGLHKRRHFHAAIDTAPADEWEHYEMTPSAGGPPIRFRLFWLDLNSEEARNPDSFFEGFAAPLDELRARVEGANP